VKKASHRQPDRETWLSRPLQPVPQVPTVTHADLTTGTKSALSELK